LAAPGVLAADEAALIGFTPEGSRRQGEVEAAFLALPQAERCEAHHRELTKSPHTAGTEGARRVAAYVADRFREYGLETEVAAYDVLLSSARAVQVEMTAPGVVRPVRLANDANCFALSEATDGAARGARVVFGVIVGTGTGGGIVVDGRVLTGPNAIAGEWGHIPLPWPKDEERPGPACYCGKSGCVETYLSGPGLARDYREATGSELDAVAIAERAASGDAAAEGALARYEDRMARALATVLNVLDPDVVVLGGGMSRLARLYESVPRLWQAWAFSDRVTTPLRSPVHGDASGVRGAAWLWGDE
jgi:hypothetical protein